MTLNLQCIHYGLDYLTLPTSKFTSSNFRITKRPTRLKYENLKIFGEMEKLNDFGLDLLRQVNVNIHKKLKSRCEWKSNTIQAIYLHKNPLCGSEKKPLPAKLFQVSRESCTSGLSILNFMSIWKT